MDDRWRELYGGERPGAGRPDPAALAFAEVATFRQPRGEDPAGPFQPPFLARSVGVDNATGRWWRVADRWIPPWTIGAAVSVVPPSNQLLVERITPAGQISEAVGAELVLVATTAALPPDAGLAAPPAGLWATERVTSGYTVTTSGGPPIAVDLVPEPPAGRRIALARYAVTYSELSTNRQGPARLMVGWRTAAGPGFAGVATVVVSVASPAPAERRPPRPILWPVAGADPSLFVGITLLGQQLASYSPTQVTVELDYFVAEP